MAELFLSNCPPMNVTGLYWRWVNIGSGNGLVPSGNKPLPEPMLTQINIAIWQLVLFNWYKKFFFCINIKDSSLRPEQNFQHLALDICHSIFWQFFKFHLSIFLKYSNWCPVNISSHYRNQSRGCLMEGGPLWPPAVPRLAAWPSQSNPWGSGPEVLKRDRGHVTSESGVSEVGVFRALQPNDVFFTPQHQAITYTTFD